MFVSKCVHKLKLCFVKTCIRSDYNLCERSTTHCEHVRIEIGRCPICNVLSVLVWKKMFCLWCPGSIIFVHCYEAYDFIVFKLFKCFTLKLNTAVYDTKICSNGLTDFSIQPYMMMCVWARRLCYCNANSTLCHCKTSYTKMNLDKRNKRWLLADNK